MFFLCKQKTAYEMRISDWSSDVCSSDLPTSLEAFEAKKEMVAPKAHVDYGLYGGGLYPRTVADLAKAGAIGIKVFNTRHIKEVYPYISELGVLDHVVLYELSEAVRDCNLSSEERRVGTEGVSEMRCRGWRKK